MKPIYFVNALNAATLRRMLVLMLLTGIVSCSNPGSVPTANETETKPIKIQFLKDVRYGSYERNLLDLWVPDAKEPSPLVLFIHGGGFRSGDKNSLSMSQFIAFLEAGFAVAALNYRLTDTAPAPAAYLDCARALQFLRYSAGRWNIDPGLVASTGSSAGAGISMWLAFHDDMADPKSDDPVARQSTRLVCVAVRNGQPSYDPRYAEKAGIPRPNFERDGFFFPFYNINQDEINSVKAFQRYEAAAPITYLTPDDPPVLLEYTYPNDMVDENTTLPHIIHHPKLGLALKERLDAMGIECIVQYAGEGGQLVRHNAGSGENVVDVVEFLKKHFAASKGESE